MKRLASMLLILALLTISALLPAAAEGNGHVPELRIGTTAANRR